jgi:Na+-driven multidrug efflux pump
VLAKMQTPADALPFATAYLRIIFLGIPFRYLYAFFMMSLRGAGDSKRASEIARHVDAIVAWSFILFGVTFVLSGVVRSTGAVVPPLVIHFFSVWIARIPFAYLLMPRIGADAIWWSFPSGSVISLVLSVLYYRLGGWRRARMLEPAAAPEAAAVPAA